MKGSSQGGSIIKMLYSFFNGQYSPGIRKNALFYINKKRARRSPGGMFKVNQRAELKRSRRRKMKCSAR